MKNDPDEFSASTRLVRMRPNPKPEPPPVLPSNPTVYKGPPPSDDRTRFIGRPSDENQGGQLGDEGLTDPPVGWLVIVGGPGRGNALPLGYQQNSIGRQDCRVTLDYDDKQISREAHCYVIFEPEQRIFILTRGTSSGLAYLNGQVVLTPTEIHLGDLIRLGSTFLRFVPLCGQDFDWAAGPITGWPEPPAGYQAAPPTA